MAGGTTRVSKRNDNEQARTNSHGTAVVCLCRWDSALVVVDVRAAIVVTPIAVRPVTIVLAADVSTGCVNKADVYVEDCAVGWTNAVRALVDRACIVEAGDVVVNGVVTTTGAVTACAAVRSVSGTAGGA